MKINFNFKKFMASFVVVAFILGLVPNATIKAWAEDINTKKIQILVTTDLHGRFQNYEYARDIVSDGGLTQIATLVQQQKALNPNTLVLDNGDTIQGNYNHLFTKPGVQNPMVLAMKYIGYDAFNLGNHEYNFGMSLLNETVSQAGTQPQVLCANLYKDGSRVFTPFIIKNIDGVKVAVIGVVTPWITKWDGPNLTGYEAKNPTEEVSKVISEIKTAGGADAYVVLAHMGETEEYGNGDSATGIATANPEVSAIVMGHSHAKQAGKVVNNALLIQPGNNGAELGQIELTVEKQANDTYKVINKASKLLATKGVAVDTNLTKQLESYHNTALADARTVIGTLDKDLAIADEVKGIPESLVSDQGVTDLVNEVQVFNMKKYLEAKGIDYTNGNLVSAAALFDATSNMKAGDITKAGVSNIYKYDNKLYVIKTNGKQLKKFMEWTASIYNTFNPGDLTVSLNETIRLYNYDMFDGIKYEVNISKPAGSRIENVSFENGNVFSDDSVVYLAVNNYRYDSILNAATNPVFELGTHEKIYDTNNDTISDMRDLIIDYVSKAGTINRNVDNNWKLTGVNYDATKRATAVRLINEGDLKLPTSADGRTPNVKSVTWADVLNTSDKKIDIMSFNDFHGNVEESGKNIGAAKLATLIKDKKKLKSSEYEAFVVSAGDLYQGTAISNLTYGKPVSDFLKEIGLTASAIGNHEFDWGVDKISTWSKDGAFPFLAANIVDKATGKAVSWAKPYEIISSNGYKVGIIGITTQETLTKTKAENVKDINFLAPADVVNKYAKQLKEVDKVDAVVVLSHLGAMTNSTTKEITGEAADLAKAVTNVDAIIGAHDHQFTAGKVNNVAIVEAGYNGRGLSTLTFGFNVEGKLVLVNPSTDLAYNRVKDIVADANVGKIVADYKAQLDPILGVKVLEFTKYLEYNSYNGLQPLGIVVAETMRKLANAEICITNGGGIRIPLVEDSLSVKGYLTVGEFYRMLPFDNTLVTMDLLGADIKVALENGIMPTNMGWGQFSGIKVWYDETKPAGSRVTSIRLADGTPLAMDKYYKVVVNDFMLTGGDGYNFKNAKNVTDTNIVMRDGIMNDWKVNGINYNFENLLFKGADDTVVVTPETKPEVTPEVKPEVKPETGKGDLPSTGGTNSIYLIVFGAVIAGSGYYVSRKKTNKDKNIA